MNSLETDLEQRLAELRRQDLFRALHEVDSPQGARLLIDNVHLLNFSSNDYLGLAGHPALKEASCRAIAHYGAGSGSSRLICGSLHPHHALEAALTAFKGVEASLAFSSGYACALGTITSLLTSSDVVIVDKLVHASLVDAARLCGATLRVFPHNDLNKLESLLRWASARPGRTQDSAISKPTRGKRILVIVESVYSMDGDHAPLREVVALKEKYGAWLMVDEAHATGLYGPRRRGLCESLNVADRVEIQMGTLGKAVGAAGGYICGRRVLVDFLVNRARSFIFSTGPVPAAAAAAEAGVQLIAGQEGEQRCALLWSRVGQLREGLERWRDSAPPSLPANSQGSPATRPNTLWESALASAPSAIIPLVVGAEALALHAASALRRQGCLIPAIRYPTVARGAARLRLTLSASHTTQDLETVLKALQRCDQLV